MEPDNAVALSVLKAHGSPLANGELAASDPRERLTARLYDMTGQSSAARLRGFLPMHEAAICDLMEAPIESVTVSDGAIDLDVAGAQIVTLTMQPAGLAVAAGDLVSLEDERANIPEYARYWLHNRGVAPTGAHPVSVHLHGPSHVERPDDLPRNRLL